MSTRSTTYIGIGIGIVLLVGLVLTLWLRGRTPESSDAAGHARTDTDTPGHVDGTSSSTSRPRGTAGGRAASRGGDGAAPEGARTRTEATVDVVGGSGDGGPVESAGTDGDGAGIAAEGTMAEIGAALGIDTSMDDRWTLEDEASQWFAPVEEAFEAARPLTPEKYKGIVGEHQDTTTQVFKRSAEIADELGSDRGIAFIEAYNDLVDGYRDEAYGTP